MQPMKTASMNQQQKREKAAELLGWKKNKHPMSGEELWYNTTLRPDMEGFSGWLNPPSYDEDLNLMAEAVKTMKFSQRQQYYKALQLICSIPFRDDLVAMQECIEATAAQRLDAWLEVMMEGES